MNFTPKVLVVDDEDDLRSLLKMGLETIGIEVVAEEDGLAGVRAWFRALSEGRKFDGVLLDISLPVMQGLGAARIIRCAESAMNTKTCPVAIGFFSAVTDKFEEVGALDEVHATLKLQKPIGFTNLQEQVWAWLGLPPRC